MTKRISLVWKRPEITDAEFRRLWLGEHVDYAKKLVGLREYVIDFATEAPDGAPSGIATLRFDTRDALDAAFNVPKLREDLFRTREQFAQRVQVIYVDEHVVMPHVASDSK
jgi:uncharacterized protein (TIGR02118 family)